MTHLKRYVTAAELYIVIIILSCVLYYPEQNLELPPPGKKADLSLRNPLFDNNADGSCRTLTEITVIHPNMGCPEIIKREQSFNAIVHGVEGNETPNWKAILSTWYSVFRLNVTSAIYDDPDWMLEIEIPVYVLEDIYDLTVTANGANHTQPHAVSVVKEINDKFDFVHVTDTHVGNQPKNTYRDFAELIREINFVNPAFVIDSGDCCDKLPDGYEQQDIPQNQQDEMYRNRIAKDPGLNVPIYIVPGNHDYSYWPTTDIEDFREYLNPELNFAFDYGDHAHFLGIDSQVTWPGCDGGTAGGNGITDEQMAWIESELRSNMNRNHRFTFMHHKPSNETGNAPNGPEPYLEQNADEYRELMRTYNVTFSMHGHEHRDKVYDRDFNDVAEDGSIDEREFPLFVLTTSGTKEGSDGEGYRLIRVNGSKIDLYTYDGDGNGARDELESIPRGRIDIDYFPANDGSVPEVTATVVNELRESFEEGHLEFIMPPLEAGEGCAAAGEWYDLSGNRTPGRRVEITQLINIPGEVCICRVSVDVPELSRLNVTVNIVEDNAPPEITHVWSRAGNSSGGTYREGNKINFTIVEGRGKGGLTGNITMTLLEPDGNITAQYIEIGDLRDEGCGVYHYEWDTAAMTGGIYHVETALSDRLGNSDDDGLPRTPDLIITLIDEVPPVVSVVTSSVGEDMDGIYEIGSVVNISIMEKFGEERLSGTITITSNTSDPGVREQALIEVRNGVYYFLWNTSGMVPADDYEVETTLMDISSNVDEDGLCRDPDLVITLVDETAPVISSVASSLVSLAEQDTDGIYHIGSEVIISVTEMYNETGLTGTITITSATCDPGIGKRSLVENENGVYCYVWNTAGMLPGNDYCVETTLADRYDNVDRDGLPGTDLVIILKEPPDVTPPEPVTGIYACDTPDDNGGSITVTWEIHENLAGDFSHYDVYCQWCEPQRINDSSIRAHKSVVRSRQNEPSNISLPEPEIRIDDIGINKTVLATCNGSSLTDGHSYFITVVAVDTSFNFISDPIWAGPVIPRDNVPPRVNGFRPVQNNITVNESGVMEFFVIISPDEPDRSKLEYRWYLNGNLTEDRTNRFVLKLWEVNSGKTLELSVVVLDPGGNAVDNTWTITVKEPESPNDGEHEKGNDDGSEGVARWIVIIVLVVIVVMGLAALFFFIRKRRGKNGSEEGEHDEIPDVSDDKPGTPTVEEQGEVESLEWGEGK